MDKKTFFSIFVFMISVLMPLSLTSCDNDITPSNPDTTHTEELMTEFSESSAKTRTTTDSARYFYWTQGDELWVDRVGGESIFDKSNSSNISAKQPTANFFFNNTFPLKQYQVYYTGQGSASTENGLRVSIATSQTQTNPDDGSHIATDGDCGTALAKENNSKFVFQLEHKAAYLKVFPYLASSMPAGVKLKSFQIVAANNDTIAGTYPFNKDGLDTLNVTSPTNTVTLTCGTSGFPIRKEEYGMSINGAYVVIQPGVHTLTFNYTLEFLSTGNSIVISKEVSEREYRAGSSTNIRHKLEKPYTFDFPNMYYMWDAKEWYWYGVSGYPTVNNGTNANYPKSITADPLRYYQSRTAPAQAEYSAANMPNANEIYWYVQGTGTIYWDNTLQWTIGGRVLTGGIWLKKSNHISGFNKETAPNGIDARQTYPGRVQVNLTTGKPSDTSQYFFLPAFGYILNGQLTNVGSYGIYWFSSTIPGVVENGYNFDFAMVPGNSSPHNGTIWIDSSGVRYYGCPSGDIVAGLFE